MGSVFRPELIFSMFEICLLLRVSKREAWMKALPEPALFFRHSNFHRHFWTPREMVRVGFYLCVIIDS